MGGLLGQAQGRRPGQLGAGFHVRSGSRGEHGGSRRQGCRRSQVKAKAERTDGSKNSERVDGFLRAEQPTGKQGGQEEVQGNEGLPDFDQV